MRWCELVGGAGSKGGEGDLAAGALEEGAADLALERGHQAADPGFGQVEPLGAAPEVQLLGNDEERLDLGQVHSPLDRRGPLFIEHQSLHKSTLIGAPGMRTMAESTCSPGKGTKELHEMPNATKLHATGRIEVKSYEPTTYDKPPAGPELVEIHVSETFSRRHRRRWGGPLPPSRTA